MAAIHTEVELARDYISQLFQDLILYYQAAKDERKRIAEIWVSEEEFTVLEELELLTADIRGYASQFKVYGRVSEPAAAATKLHKMRILDTPAVAQWYFNSSKDYLKMKFYIQMLDYLRLLVLEYIELHQQEEETPKSAPD